MTYLITGGTGFIGAHLTRLLVQEGKEVVTYNRDPRRDILEYLVGREQLASVRVIRGDITDLAHLMRTAREFNVTTIVHMAAMLSRASAENPLLAVRINCEGTANIFETARILQLEKVVYASSNTVFGPPEKYDKEVISNDAPHYPGGVYGACKSLNERLAEYYFNEYGVDSVGLRFPVVYGVGHKEGAASSMLTEELMVKPALGKPGRVPYSGDQVLNWLYVEDAVRGVIMAARKARTKTRAFNMGGDICSVSAAAEYVKKLIPGADLTLLPKRIEFTGRFESTQIRDEIGFQAQWTLERGIKQVIDSVRHMEG